MLDTNVVSTPNVLKLNGYPIILLLQSEMVQSLVVWVTIRMAKVILILERRMQK